MKKSLSISPKQYALPIGRQAFFRLLFEEAENKKSPLSQYLNKLAFKFVLENLEPPNREIFLEKLDYKKGKALAFAKTKIDNFDLKLNFYLQNNLQKIQGKF